MARPITWLGRLPEIRRSVSESVRSHYTTRELQQLLQLQRRATQVVMEALDVQVLNGDHLVPREVLLAFLERVAETDDVPGLMRQMRKAKGEKIRRKLRVFIQRDHPPASLTGIPATLKLSPGRVEIQFATMEELVRQLLTMSLILQDELDEFTRLYEPPKPPVPEEDDERKGVEQMFDELREMEAKHKAS